MPIQSTDYFLIDDNGVSKRIRADNLKAGFKSTHSNKKMLVNLSDKVTSRFVYAGDLSTKVNSNHWMLLERNGVKYAVRGDLVSDYFTETFKRMHYASDGQSQTISSLDTVNGESLLMFMDEVSGRPGFIDTIRGGDSIQEFFFKKAQGSSNGNFVTFGTDSFTLEPGLPYPNDNDARFINRTYGNRTYKVWQFKSSPGFFDIVTWTGNGSERIIPHALGATPGMIMISEYQANGNPDQQWFNYHKNLGPSKYIRSTDDNAFNNTSLDGDTPNSSHFKVTGSTLVNDQYNNSLYVAYIFADNPAAGIKCDEFTGNGAAEQQVNVGFTPEAVIVKKVSGGTAGVSNGYWNCFDQTNDKVIRLSRADNSPDGSLVITNNGFKAVGSFTNDNGSRFVYMAVK